MIFFAGMIILGMGNHLERFVGNLEFFFFATKLSISVNYVALVVATEAPSKVDVFSVWQPSEQNTYADIEAAYKCLEESYGTKQEDIILYGQSVGNGPTLQQKSSTASVKSNCSAQSRTLWLKSYVSCKAYILV